MNVGHANSLTNPTAGCNDKCNGRVGPSPMVKRNPSFVNTAAQRPGGSIFFTPPPSRSRPRSVKCASVARADPEILAVEASACGGLRARDGGHFRDLDHAAIFNRHRPQSRRRDEELDAVIPLNLRQLNSSVATPCRRAPAEVASGLWIDQREIHLRLRALKKLQLFGAPTISQSVSAPVIEDLPH